MEIKDLPDDFQDDKYMQKIYAARAARKKLISGTFSLIGNRFSYQEEEFFTAYPDLNMFSGYENFEEVQSEFYLSGLRKLEFSIINYTTRVRTPRYHYEGSDDYLFGILQTNRAFPHTTMVPQTIDKTIAEILSPQEFKWPQSRKFSRHFHIMTADKYKLATDFLGKDLNPLARFKTAEIELRDNMCTFRTSRKPLNPEETEMTIELAHILTTIF